MSAELKIEMDILNQSDNVGVQSYSVSSGQPINNLSKQYVSGTTLGETKRNDGYIVDLYTFGQPLTATWALGKDGGYNGYRWGLVDSYGKINGNYLQFSVNAPAGGNVSLLSIFGDANNSQWPTEAILDEGLSTQKTVTNSNRIFVINFDGNAITRTVKITAWNRVGYNAAVTHIEAFGNAVTFDSRWIKSISTTSQQTANADEISFGAIANAGSIEINDVENEISDYIKDGIITNSETPIKIKAKNTVIQHHLSQSSEYKDNKLSIQLTNKLSRLDLVDYPGRPLTKTASLYTLFCEVLEDYLNDGIQLLHGDRYLDYLKDSDGNITVTGQTSASEVTKTSDRGIQYYSGHKYYMSYYYKHNQWSIPCTTEMFFPIAAGNSITSGTITFNWQHASGIVQSTSFGNGFQRFRIDFNNLQDDSSIWFKDIIICDLTANGLADKDKAWCDAHIINSGHIDSMFKGQCHIYSSFTYINSVYNLIDFAQYILIPYPYIEAGTYRETVDKLCQLGMFKMYCDDNDGLSIVTALPSSNYPPMPYQIKKGLRFGRLNSSKFVRNKINSENNIMLSENKVRYDSRVVHNVIFIGYDSFEDENNYQPTFSNKNSFDVMTIDLTSGSNSQKFAIFTQIVKIDGRTKFEGLSATYKPVIVATEGVYVNNTINGEAIKSTNVGFYDTVNDFISSRQYRFSLGPYLKTNNLVDVGIITSESTDSEVKFIFAVVLRSGPGFYYYTIESDIEVTLKTLTKA